MPVSKDPVVRQRLLDQTRNVRLATVTKLQADVNGMRINLGPRHPACQTMREACALLGVALEQIRSASE